MDQPNITQRVERLEKQVAQLLSLLPKVEIVPTMDSAEQLVLDELGATEVREIEEISQVGDTGWGEPTPARKAASERAQTVRAIAIPDNFNPGLMGYTGYDFVADFPGVDAQTVLNSFISHHRSKGDVSKNWMEKFFSYAANAVKIEKERRQSQPKARETDSMGLPLDRGARIRAKRAELENHRQRVEYENEREDTV